MPSQHLSGTGRPLPARAHRGVKNHRIGVATVFGKPPVANRRPDNEGFVHTQPGIPPRSTVGVPVQRANDENADAQFQRARLPFSIPMLKQHSKCSQLLGYECVSKLSFSWLLTSNHSFRKIIEFVQPN